jgi:nucleoside 2-deoxyribosyltransferase
MRGKEMLPKNRELKPYEYPDAGAFGVTQGIVTRDRFDVRSCDVMLVNLLQAEIRRQVSIGTMVEIGWADAWRKPMVLVWNKERNPHRHLFLDGLCTYHTDKLEEGIYICRKLLNQ